VLLGGVQVAVMPGSNRDGAAPGDNACIDKRLLAVLLLSTASIVLVLLLSSQFFHEPVETVINGPPGLKAEAVGGDGGDMTTSQPTRKRPPVRPRPKQAELLDLWNLQVMAENNCTNAISIMGDLYGRNSTFLTAGSASTVAFEALAGACLNKTFDDWLRFVYNDLGVREVAAATGGHLHFGCNAATKRCMYQGAHCGYNVPPCDVLNLEILFGDVAIYLDTLAETYPELEWSLYGGTLLGAVRDQKHMAHETDIDLGLYCGNKSKEIIHDLIAAIRRDRSSYYVTEIKKESDLKKIRKVSFSRLNKLHVDLWLYDKNDELDRVEVLAPYYGELFNHSYAGWYPIERTCTYGPLTGLPCPQNPGIQLTELYGEDWRIPYKKQAMEGWDDPESCKAHTMGSKYWKPLNDGL